MQSSSWSGLVGVDWVANSSGLALTLSARVVILDWVDRRRAVPVPAGDRRHVLMPAVQAVAICIASSSTSSACLGHQPDVARQRADFLRRGRHIREPGLKSRRADLHHVQPEVA